MKNISKEYPIALVLNPKNTIYSTPIRCVFCGRILCKINKRIATIFINNMGLKPSDLKQEDSCTEIKCRGCEFYYRIYVPSSVKVEISTDDLTNEHFAGSRRGGGV